MDQDDQDIGSFIYDWGRTMIRPRKLKYLTEKNRNNNYRFRTWLKMNAESEDLDQRFLRLHRELFENYDCSRCRNCCKQYYGSIPAADINKDADGLNMTVPEFIDKYLDAEKGMEEGAFITKDKPCNFLLEDGSCLLGDNKPDNCVKYPYTDQPDRRGSLLSFLETISVCPVAYEIWERLKEDYRWY